MKTRDFRIQGIIPVMVTPFDAAGQVELDGLRRESEYLSRAGVHALCVGGVISETAGASPEEVHLLCETVTSTTDKPVLAGIFPDCTTEALDLSDAAVSAGAQALLVAPPHYLFAPDCDGLLELFSTLRKQVTVPLLFSNCIQTAQVELAWITALIERELIDGIHQAGGNAHLLADVLQLSPRVPVYTGVEDLIYMAFLLGAEGAISALATVFPEECVNLYQATREADWTRAVEIHARLNRLWRVLDHPVELFSRIKSTLALQGRPAGVPRSPYNVMSSDGQRLLREALERQGKSYG